MSLEIKVPPVGESITEVTLSSWIKKDGDVVQMDEVIAELESDKATFELTATEAGTLKTVAEEGDVLPIGAVVCTIEAGAAAPVKEAAPAKVAATATATPTKEEAQEEETLAKTTAETAKGSTYAAGTPSPAAAKILAEKGIDPATLNGNGVGGRITKGDALNAEKSESPKVGKSESGPA